VSHEGQCREREDTDSISSGRKPPLVCLVVVFLLFANTFPFLLLDFGAEYFLPHGSLGLQPCQALSTRGNQYHAPHIVCLCAGHSIAIQFILLVMVFAIF